MEKFQKWKMKIVNKIRKNELNKFQKDEKRPEGIVRAVARLQNLF